MSRRKARRRSKRLDGYTQVLFVCLRDGNVVAAGQVVESSRYMVKSNVVNNREFTTDDSEPFKHTSEIEFVNPQNVISIASLSPLQL